MNACVSWLTCASSAVISVRDVAASSNPFMESADVRAESEGTWTEYERQVAANVATQASLDGRPDADIRKALSAPLPPAVLDAIARTESARLKASEEDFKKETGALRDCPRRASILGSEK